MAVSLKGRERHTCAWGHLCCDYDEDVKRLRRRIRRKQRQQWRKETKEATNE